MLTFASSVGGGGVRFAGDLAGKFFSLIIGTTGEGGGGVSVRII